MTEKIRWAVLGNAAIARKCMLPAIAKSRNGRIRLLGTRRPDQAKKLCRMHGIEKAVGDYNAVLNDPDVDAVYLPLPNHMHHTWTLKALAAGKHVLCEKPLACNASQAEEMARAAQAAGRVLMEAFMYRFHPRSRQIKTRVVRGDIGRPHLIRSAFTFHISSEVLDNCADARLMPDAGGGALLDVGCYGVSTARWLLDSEPQSVQAMAVRHANGVDLLFVGLLAFEGEAMATIEAGFVTALQQTFSIVGSRGAIELPHNAFIPWEANAEYVLRQVDQASGEVVRVDGADEYLLMVEHFGDVVLGHSLPAMPPAESVRNLRVLDALAQAAQTGRTVELQ